MEASLTDQPSILVTGAGGQLGELVVARLLARTPAASVAALVRTREAGAPLAALGVVVRVGDYDRPATLDAALAGIQRVLLISSNALGRRAAQHRNVVEAAKRAGVGLVAYTSVLHAEGSPLGLAGEHRDTEALLRASGVPFVLLRNGWYTENHTAAIPAALAHHALIGGAGDGRISAAARDDYAAAAAAVLLSEEEMGGRVFELAGDHAFTLGDLAAEIARQSGQEVAYRDLPRSEHEAALLGAGLPDFLAALIADSDACAARDALFDERGQLGRLIGRPTTPMAASVAAALAAG